MPKRSSTDSQGDIPKRRSLRLKDVSTHKSIQSETICVLLSACLKVTFRVCLHRNLQLRQRPNPSQRRHLQSLRKPRRWRRPSLRRKHQRPLLRMAKPKLRKRHQLQTQLKKKTRRQNNISPTTSFTSAPCTSFLVQFRGIFLSTIF